MSHKLTVFLLLPLLAACIAQTDIQADYMRAQSSCRDTAEAGAANVPPGAPEEQHSMALAKGFSDCMIRTGWHVSTPKGTTVVVQNPPTGSPSTNPSAATATVVTVGSTPSAPTNPPTGSPSTNPIAAAKSPAPTPSAGAQTPGTAGQDSGISGAATYQPGRPTTVIETTPAYGGGAGRQF